MRAMRCLISRQWSVLQDLDITGESGDLRYQVRGNQGVTQSLTITEPTGQHTAQITRTPFTPRQQVIIDGRQAAEVRADPPGAQTALSGSGSGCGVDRRGGGPAASSLRGQDIKISWRHEP